ncbi:MAG: DUF177 domain-containing protein [Flavobacteriales bacterium]|nr:DUF177 domain-containing protein [Flavobacteriales bacterium]
MDVLKPYRIPFRGLKEGIHQFEFRLDGAFFEEFENEELIDSSFSIDLELDKKPTFLELRFDFEGEFKTECDRCMEGLTLPINGSRDLIAKENGDMDDEDIICIGMNDTEVDLSRVFYEAIVIALPLKRAHEESDCDPEVLNDLDTYSRSDSEEMDPRWEALKKLK